VRPFHKGLSGSLRTIVQNLLFMFPRLCIHHIPRSKRANLHDGRSCRILTNKARIEAKFFTHDNQDGTGGGGHIQLDMDT